MRSAWRLLKLPHVNVSLPPLLIKYELGTSDYTVLITDLTLLWRESLDRKRIIRRSFDVDTSIDPSEDSDQLRLFLQKVGDALEQKPGTTIDLVQNGSDKSLLLRTLTSLPGSLKPLQWSIELLPASQSILTAELIVPMLSQHVISNVEKASLLQQLKEKDLVIAKLTDKMHSDGVDLSRLFPSISSRSGKSTSRQTLGKSVKGLGEFDEDRWRKHIVDNGVSFDGFQELVADAFEIDMTDWPENAPIPEYKSWWVKLSHKDSHQEDSSRDLSSLAEGLITQDEFQRQPTPTKHKGVPLSHAKQEKVAEPEKIKIDTLEKPVINSDSTTDESDQDSKSPLPDSTPPNKQSIDHATILNSTLRTPSTSHQIGSGKKLTHEGYQEQIPIREADSQIASSDRQVPPADSMESEIDAHNQPRAASKPRAKLGKIGGKGKLGKRDEPLSETGHAPPAAASESSRFVDVGAHTEVGPFSKNRVESERTGRMTIQPGESSLPRETSQERANRNREKLKRELETKSHTGAKKKRKF